MADISRLLITGANGLIGQSIPFGIKCSREELDVTNPASISTACEKYKPSAILALSSLDLRACENDPLAAYMVNVWGIYNLAKESARRNIPLVMISSGAVFNGPAEKVFSESDIPAPINVYGQTKYLAELIVQNVAPKHIIIRTGWVYGDMPKKGGFAKFVDSAALAAKKKEPIKANSSQYGSPTLINDLVSNIKKLIEEDAHGTFHIANEGRASAANIAHEITRILGSVSKIEVISNALPSTGPQRSPSEALHSSKIPMRPWKEALQEYVSKL